MPDRCDDCTYYWRCLQQAIEERNEDPTAPHEPADGCGYFRQVERDAEGRRREVLGA